MNDESQVNELVRGDVKFYSNLKTSAGRDKQFISR